MHLAHADEIKPIAKNKRILPLLKHTKNLFPDVSLEKVKIFCAQHVVSTTYALLKTLFECGLPKENLSIIGKCYSTDPQIFDLLKAEGIDICPSSIQFDSHEPFDDQYHLNLKKFLVKRAKFSKANIELIVFLDDGGDLLSLAPQFMASEIPMVGIEQTSSGYHKLKRKDLHFPIINVARSAAKLYYETPFIGNQLVEILIDKILNLHLRSDKILIIGNGFIGQSIHARLPDHDIVFYDKDPEKSHIDKDDFAASLKHFDLVIGCTGKTVIPYEMHHLLKKGCTLISASSSDREFDAVFLRKKLKPYKNCHKDIEVKEIHLLNSGFPLNFSEEYDKIDINEFQLTRSLLMSAILQAAMHDTPEKGFVPLDIETQREIIEKFLILFPHQKELQTRLSFPSLFLRGLAHGRK